MDRLVSVEPLHETTQDQFICLHLVLLKYKRNWLTTGTISHTASDMMTRPTTTRLSVLYTVYWVAQLPTRQRYIVSGLILGRKSTILEREFDLMIHASLWMGIEFLSWSCIAFGCYCNTILGDGKWGYLCVFLVNQRWLFIMEKLNCESIESVKMKRCKLGLITLFMLKV